MRFTGSRVTETLRLSWAAIHADRIVFVKKTTKTKATREPMVAGRLAEEVQRYRKHWTSRQGREPRPKDFGFPGGFGLGEPMTRQAADLAFRKTLAGLDLPSGISVHSFRRSLATGLAHAGVSLRTVQRFTGHASLDQLARYIDVEPRDELHALAAIGGA